MSGQWKASAFAAALVSVAAWGAAAQDPSPKSVELPTAPVESVYPPSRPGASEPANSPRPNDEFLQELNRRGAENRAERGVEGDSASEDDLDTLPPSSTSWLLRGVGATAFVLGLIVLLGYLARRFGGKSAFLAGSGLASVMGRVYLAKGAALYYVRTGGRVLVVGVTNNTMSLVGEFDAAAFDEEDAEPESPAPPELGPRAFLSQLRSSASAIRSTEDGEFTGDMEIDSLKADIRRLQSLLEEESRETR